MVSYSANRRDSPSIAVSAPTRQPDAGLPWCATAVCAPTPQSPRSCFAPSNLWRSTRQWRPAQLRWKPIVNGNTSCHHVAQATASSLRSFEAERRYACLAHSTLPLLHRSAAATWASGTIRKDGPYRRLPIRPGNQCVFASARRGRISVPLHPARRCATLMFFGPDEEAGILRRSSPQGRVAQNSFSIRALTFCASNRDFGGLPSHQGYPPKILLRRRALRQQN